MAFVEILGRAIRLAVTVPARHDYIQIKFNAIVFSPNQRAGVLNYVVRADGEIISNQNRTI